MATVWCLLCVIYLTVALSKKYEQTNNENNCDSEWERQVNYDADADRIYYIACVEEEWNYCPSGKNLVSGLDIIPGSNEAMWCLGNGVDRIGPKYVKALYREYTNNCFTEQKQRSSRDEHLGALGPNIRALTGEKIKIFYKNLCSITTSLHVHGLQYDKTSEGAPYDDQSLEGDNISPNGQWIHLFHSRKTNVDKGTSSKMWIYHSHIDEPADVSSGLFGAIIVTKKGKETSATNLMPKDIDREFTTFMVLYDEIESRMYEKNLKIFLDKTRSEVPNDSSEEGYDDYEESNLMHAINGYLFGNLDDLICQTGEKVRWYTASFGNEGDGPHSPHWHGNIAVDTVGENTDTVSLIPGTTSTVTMYVDQPGKWLYHCHVHDHIYAGMMTTYSALCADKGDYCKKNDWCCDGFKCNRKHKCVVGDKWSDDLSGGIYEENVLINSLLGLKWNLIVIGVILVNVIWCCCNYRKQKSNKYKVVSGDEEA
eukprot:179192_1